MGSSSTWAADQEKAENERLQTEHQKEGNAKEQIERQSELGRQVGGTHYKNLPMQPMEANIRNGTPWAEGEIIKYVTRWRSKGGVQDLKKAAHILQTLIEHALTCDKCGAIDTTQASTLVSTPCTSSRTDICKGTMRRECDEPPRTKLCTFSCPDCGATDENHAPGCSHDIADEQYQTWLKAAYDGGAGGI